MPRKRPARAPAVKGQCKDCPAGVKRLVRRPGPRCAEHARAFKAQTRTASHGRWIQSTYGLTLDEYQAIYESQGGKCAICRRATGRSKRLSVDHDHRTGEVRGLLCTVCNRDVLGHLRDSIASLLRAVRYLMNPPARRVLTKLRGKA